MLFYIRPENINWRNMSPIWTGRYFVCLKQYCEEWPNVLSWVLIWLITQHTHTHASKTHNFVSTILKCGSKLPILLSCQWWAYLSSVATTWNQWCWPRGRATPTSTSRPPAWNQRTPCRWSESTRCPNEDPCVQTKAPALLRRGLQPPAGVRWPPDWGW